MQPYAAAETAAAGIITVRPQADGVCPYLAQGQALMPAKTYQHQLRAAVIAAASMLTGLRSGITPQLST